jgi:hypothetical protein
MKHILTTLALLFFVINISAQSPPPKAEDVDSMENIMAALYDVISGPKGEKRDWDRMRSLFHENAKLIPTGKNAQGEIQMRYWTVDEYISTAGASLERDGFFEVETHRIVEDYGTITHVFSTYDSRRNLSDEKPFARGINSIQLLKDDHRWYILNITWMGETPAFPLPEKYLSK